MLALEELRVNALCVARVLIERLQGLIVRDDLINDIFYLGDVLVFQVLVVPILDLADSSAD